jgi:glycosyltransferase involved in cell wall biosynthesis
MRIIKIIHGYPPFYNAGSEVYSQSICNELSINNELFIFTREENPYEPDYSIRKEIREHNQTFYFVNMPRAKDGYRHAAIDSAFEEILKEVNPSIAHIGHLNHLSTGLVHVLKSKKIPIVFTLHDFWLMCPRGQFLQRNFGSDKTFQLCTGQENNKCATNCYNAYNSGIDKSQEQEQNYWEEWINQRMKETKEVAELVDLFI